MTKQDFIDLMNKGGTGLFTLHGKERGWGSFPNCRYQYDPDDSSKTCRVGVGDGNNEIHCETPEEILEKFMVDGIPFVELLPEIQDMRAIPFV